MTAVTPNFSNTLTLSPPGGGADSAHHHRLQLNFPRDYVPDHDSNADADRQSCAESVPKNLFDLENSWNEGSMPAHYQPPAAARFRGGGGTAGRLYGQAAGRRDCSAAQQKPDVRAARLPNSYHIINDDFPRTCCIASAECQ